VLPVDPPLLSDRSFVVLVCSCLASPDAPLSTSKRYVRNWRTLDVDAFVSDLQTSDLVVSPPDDVVAAFECYDTTLRTLLDKHAPLELKEVKCRSSARLFDSECHAAKRTTRQLESKYHRQRTTETLTAWKRQFDFQRSLYEAKFVAFWTATVDACKRNPRKLWRTVHELLQPPTQQASKELSADSFADYFRSKVATIRASTASAAPPDIRPRLVSPLTSFELVTEEEISKLLFNLPAKSC